MSPRQIHTRHPRTYTLDGIWILDVEIQKIPNIYHPEQFSPHPHPNLCDNIFVQFDRFFPHEKMQKEAKEVEIVVSKKTDTKSENMKSDQENAEVYTHLSWTVRNNGRDNVNKPSPNDDQWTSKYQSRKFLNIIKHDLKTFKRIFFLSLLTEWKKRINFYYAMAIWKFIPSTFLLFLSSSLLWVGCFFCHGLLAGIHWFFLSDSNE